MVVQYSKATHKQINIVSSTTEIEYVASSIVTHMRDYFSMVISYKFRVSSAKPHKALQ
jgi:hypothetical protein